MTQDQLNRISEMLKIASKGVLFGDTGIYLFDVGGLVAFELAGQEDRVAVYLVKDSFRYGFHVSSEPDFYSYQEAIRNAQTLFRENLQ